MINQVKEFYHQNKSELGLILLMVYVCLLGLGTIGEVWKVEWILDIPLFRPPGKYIH
jgi:hypothetical protein